MKLLTASLALMLTFPVFASDDEGLEPLPKKVTDTVQGQGQLFACTAPLECLDDLRGVSSLRKLKIVPTVLYPSATQPTLWRELSSGTKNLGLLTQLVKLDISDMSDNDDTGIGDKDDLRQPYPQDGEYLPYLVPLMNLTNLVKLDVSGNNLGRFTNFVSALVNLTHLNISDNFHDATKQEERHHVNLSCIAGLTRLTHLRCRNNLLGDKDVAAQLTVLARLPLFYLDLGGTNNIGPDEVHYVAAATTLQQLDLSSEPNSTDFFSIPIGLNYVEEGVSQLTTLTNLTFLNLLNNEIDDAGADFLNAMTQLEYLNLKKNKLTRKPAFGPWADRLTLEW